MIIKKYFFFLIIFLQLLSIGLEAQTTITLNPTKDTYLNRALRGTNYGTDNTMNVRRYSNLQQRTIIEFDISSIPAGATIISAELRLTQYNWTYYTDNITAYPLTQSWSESGATWNNRIAGSAWTNAGGTYNNSYSAQTSVGGNLNYAWDLTSMVSAWHSATLDNNGIVLIAENETSGNSTYTFYTKEATNSNYRPQLVISYCFIPVFTLGNSSFRCQERDSIIYTATSGTDSIYYSLDINSLWAGNSINPATGKVVWAKNWIGVSTITATSNSCTSTHTVTTKGSVETPIFEIGDTSYRCAGATTKTYNALANYRDSTIYSLDAASLAAGNSINRLTGAVTYVAGYIGTTSITASAYGCGGPKTKIHRAITNNTLKAVEDRVTAQQDLLEIIDVLANDVCTYDVSTLQIITPPTNGTATIIGGKIHYTPNSSFFGDDELTYRICQTGNTNCSQAKVYITVEQNIFDACVSASRAKTFYMPFPENSTQLRKSLISAASQHYLTDNVRAITSIKITYPGTVITYDHWEDGYENDIIKPMQRTTLVWGDANPSNGVAPGYPNDIIPPGGYIVLDNQFKYNERDFSNFVFDGKDKVFSTNDILISKVVGDAGLYGATPLFTVQNLKTNVYDVDYFGKNFIIPLGENVNNGINITAFRYTGLFVRAMTDGTLVRLDYNGDGTYDATKVLNEGEVWLYDGTASIPGQTSDANQANDIKAGAILTSTQPVGVDLVFGGIDTYGTRNISILPDKFYGSTYYSPIYTTNSDAPVYAFFTNILSTPITINWTCGNGSSGSFTIPANGNSYFSLYRQGGYKFESAGGETYTTMAVVDADSDGSGYDWAFKMISADQLTSHVGIAWAPGSFDKSVNHNPVWVTSPDTNTLYIKYDGNLSKVTDTLSPCNLPYDSIIHINPLQSIRIYNPYMNDQSGMTIYACDKKTFSAVWGQDAGVAGAAYPDIDVGYSLLPRCFSEIILANDDKENTDPNTPIEIAVLDNDAAFLCSINRESLTTTGLLQPSNGTIVINSDLTITYTPDSGFVGTDYFEYRICSEEYFGICDLATVTIDVIPCQAYDNQNIIKGRVYVDKQTYNHSYDGGERGAHGVKVDLYYDVNCNGIIDSEDRIEQSTISETSGNFSFTTSNGHNVKDNFDPIASLDGNIGSNNWSTNWSENGENDGINSGNVRIISDVVSGNNAISLSGINRGISRSVVFDNATSAILKFSFRRQDITVTSSQTKNLNVNINNQFVYQITTNSSLTDDFYTDVFVPLSAEQINGNSSNTLQFITTGNFSTTGYYWIDNVEIIYFNNRSCYIAKADPSNTNGTYLEDNTSTNVLPVEFASIGECSVRGYLSVHANLIAKRDTIKAMTNYPAIFFNVLLNDTIGHPNASTLSIITAPKQGTAVKNADGTITYTANSGYVGADSLVYRVCSIDDPLVCSSTTTLIYPYPREPIITNNSPICQGSQARFTISGTAGDTITYNINGSTSTTAVIDNTGEVDVIVNSASIDQTINLIRVVNKFNLELPLSLSSTVQTFTSSNSGTASYDQTICSGSSAASLSLTGSIGSIQWQSSEDNILFSDVLGATSLSYTPVALTQTTYYRAIASIAGCPSDTSNIVTITIRPLPTFTVSQNNLTCFGSNNGTITITGQGGSGQYIYYIEKETSAGSNTYTPFENSGTAKSSPHTFENLGTGNYSVKVIDSNGCEQTN